MNHRQTYFIIFILAAALALAACRETPTPATLEPVALQMAWVHEYSSAPLISAKENGRFAEQGLDVTISVGGFGEGGYIEPISQVLGGESQFGMASGPAILQARAEGKPVVAVMTILQRNPDSLISLKGSGIERPEDLVGKTVAVQAGGAMATYHGFLAMQGIDLAEVNTIERESFGIDPLISGQADVLYGWLINEAVQVEEAGQEANAMLLSDYGIDVYAFTLFTTEDTVNNRPDLVRAMMRGLIAGMQDVVSDPSAAIDHVLAYDEALDREQQQRRLDAMIPLMNPASSELGMMAPDIWELSYQLLVDEGLLTAEIDPADAYTMDFLNEIYSTSASQ